MFTVGIICGGPSSERGISLNSARTLQDHLNTTQLRTQIIFVDQRCEFYHIENRHLYSNTPSDFDFKMSEISTHIPRSQLREFLSKCNICFPVIHGKFGEDGELQALLESMDIPFVGSQHQACKNAYLKDRAQDKLQENGYATLPYLNVDTNTSQELLAEFWKKTRPNSLIVKPTNAGSSIDVFKINTVEELFKTTERLLRVHQSVQCQEFCQLPEITMNVICDQNQQPVALLPTEVEILTNRTDIFDYRAKYLPTTACRQHTPARLPNALIQRCRKTAEAIFTEFKLSDFARLDGWACPVRGFICTDINIISGFEEMSFLFKQTSLCGLDHEETVYHVLDNACRRQELRPIEERSAHTNALKPVYVIFGGASTERQVSLMSGRNVWFKLIGTTDYQPKPFFLDKSERVWQLPNSLFLHHTVEEIIEDIKIFSEKVEKIQPIRKEIHQRLGIQKDEVMQPCDQSLPDWIRQAKQEKASVLLALHGGIGENGTLQKALTQNGVPYNGSREQASETCMNKNTTISIVAAMNHPDIQVQQQKTLNQQSLHTCVHDNTFAQNLWSECNEQAEIMIIKPQSDGCSSGIVCLRHAQDLQRYAQLIINQQGTAPANTFHNQPTPIELPTTSAHFLIETYIETDDIIVEDSQLKHTPKHGWLELTIVVTEKGGKYQALYPSITISSNAVLSVEEKFQGGTGINLTPPPTSIVSAKQCLHIQTIVAQIAEQVGIHQYARLDVFYNTQSNRLQLIEVNTLPALTPSTVLFQQALAETRAIQPRDFIRKLVAESSC